MADAGKKEGGDGHVVKKSSGGGEAKKHLGEGLARLELTGQQATESLKRGAENVHQKLEHLIHKPDNK
jgi:hypothetical protein